MPSPEYARLTIDFDLRADPIAGILYDGGGHDQPFAGWMALTRTIELTLEAARNGRLSSAGASADGYSDDGTTEHSDAAIGPVMQRTPPPLQPPGVDPTRQEFQ
jgi:hypothetical protein